MITGTKDLTLQIMKTAIKWFLKNDDAVKLVARYYNYQYNLGMNKKTEKPIKPRKLEKK